MNCIKDDNMMLNSSTSTVSTKSLTCFLFKVLTLNLYNQLTIIVIDGYDCNANDLSPGEVFQSEQKELPTLNY